MKKKLHYLLIVFLLTACQVEKGVALTGTITPQETVTPDKVENIAVPTNTISQQASVLSAQTEASVVPTELVDPRSHSVPDEGECLLPLANFAFNPAFEGASGPDPTLTTRKLPSEGWEAVTAIPGLFLSEVMMEPNAELEGVQTVGNSDRIWVIFEGSEKKQIAYYQIDTDRWENIEYYAEHHTKYSETEYYTEYSEDVFISKIFIDKNNSVWVTLDITNYQGVNEDTVTVLLGMYDEASQKFNGVITLKELPAFDPNKNIRYVTVTNLQMDSQGDLWFFLYVGEPQKEAEYHLVKLSLSNYATEEHLTNFMLTRNNTDSLVISPNNRLNLLDIDEANIISYDSENGEIEKIKVFGGKRYLSSLSTLFLDNHQRFWIDDKAFLDLHHNDWYFIVDSPIFLTYYVGIWGRTKPTYSLETQDGRLWFSAARRGTGWVDPNTGEWCLFTSYPSNIVKDSEGHLWMIADGKLYRNSLQQ